MKKTLSFTLILGLCCVFMLKADITLASATLLDTITINSAGVLDNYTGVNVCALNSQQFYPPNWVDDLVYFVDASTSVETIIASHSYSNYCSYIGGCGVCATTDPFLEAIGYLISGHDLSTLSNETYYKGNFYIFFGNVNLTCTSVANCMANANEYVMFSQNATYPNAESWNIPPTTPTIEITSPETGTTITDTATNLVGYWYSIDPVIYQSITLYLDSDFIGEQSVAKIISVATTSGTFTIPLSYFGISANGQWNLKGSATYRNTQLSDMYITPDLIDPLGYNLIFDVEGFHTPYAFTDFDTWYDENVLNYETPSAWASGMIGYLQPILEKIAEFGARIQDYLDTSTAWQRGNDIGSVFPVVNAYISKINIFFGGFPIAQFFQWGILIMIGMFAIKIILKLLSFIPVIGGGG